MALKDRCAKRGDCCLAKHHLGPCLDRLTVDRIRASKALADAQVAQERRVEDHLSSQDREWEEA